jgi:hypothetical protein
MPSSTQILLDRQKRKIKALGIEINALKGNILILEEARRKEGNWEMWSSYRDYDEEIKEYCRSLRYNIDIWIREYVIKDINTVDSRLSASEKQTIIASLDGYCKQAEWESLIKRFSAGVREVIPQLFAHTIWTKHLFEDILMKPFYYFDFYGQEDMASTGADKPNGSFPAKLQEMYQMFKPGMVSGILS